MNDSENVTSRELSFPDIFKGVKRNILIPSIQRDYAQGRSSAKASKVRRDFVEALRGFIMDGKCHSLDFVYGNADNDSFIPLDGQQRLTTLWLLYLYLGSISENKEELKQFVFSYETRNSSTRFCEKLLAHSCELLTAKTLLTTIENKKGKKVKIKPSDIIKDEEWWFTNWIDDPTISGMLVMLDEIDRQFYDTDKKSYDTAIAAGKHLLDKDVSPIVFQFMSLKGFHDIDDLYIKMNARGLGLTPFEIFKSKLVEDVEKAFDTEAQRSFKSKIDVTWSDRLWKHRNKNDKNIDHFLQNALKILIGNEAPLICRIEPQHSDYLFDANNKLLTFAYNEYQKKGVEFSKELLERVICDLSILFEGATDFLSENAQISGYDTHWFDITSAIRRWILEGKNIKGDGNLTYDTRLKIHAYLKWTKVFPQSTAHELTEWMRLVHNLVAATPIDSSEDMVKGLKAIESLADAYAVDRNKHRESDSVSLSLDNWLKSQGEKAIAFLSAYQWEEEVVKADLRLNNEGYNECIERAEKQVYLDGQVGIIFYLADIYCDYPTSRNWNKNITLQDFDKVLDKALPLFDQLGDANSDVVKQFTFVKAMLAKGDYMPWSSSRRQNMYNRPGDRDYSWKRLFRADDKPYMIAFECLKNILRDENYKYSSAVEVFKSLENIGATYAGEQAWMKILTGRFGSQIMRESKQGFIGHDGNKILIYHESQRNHYHSELFTRELYEELKMIYKEKDQSKVRITYSPVKSGEDDSCAVIKNCKIYWDRNDDLAWTIDVYDIEDSTKKLESHGFETKDEVLAFIKCKIEV